MVNLSLLSSLDHLLQLGRGSSTGSAGSDFFFLAGTAFQGGIREESGCQGVGGGD